MHVSELTRDYLDVKLNYARILVNLKREAPAVFKHGGTYFMLTSACTGWDPNSAEVFYSTCWHISAVDLLHAKQVSWLREKINAIVVSDGAEASKMQLPAAFDDHCADICTSKTIASCLLCQLASLIKLYFAHPVLQQKLTYQKCTFASWHCHIIAAFS